MFLKSLVAKSRCALENLPFCSVFMFLFLFNVYVFALVGAGIV
jgi:hypothetical protein